MKSTTKAIASRVLIADGQPVESGGIGTMSKSKNNGVDPQALIEEYGADIARFFMMFTSPPEDTLMWKDAGVEGAARFLRRLWTFGYELAQSAAPAGARRARWRCRRRSPQARREIHAQLKQANYDMGRHQFNTVASAGMKILNALEAAQKSGAEPSLTRTVVHEGFNILLRLLAPITPHVTHQLWRDLGYGGDILDAPWPEHDPQRADPGRSRARRAGERQEARRRSACRAKPASRRDRSASCSRIRRCRSS